MVAARSRRHPRLDRRGPGSALVFSTWAHGQVEDTNPYIDTVRPLASDPAIQDAMAARIEQVIFSYLDIDAATEALVSAISQQGLPAPVAATLQAAVGPLASGIRNFVSDRVEEFVRSDAFADAWVQANREAHSQLVAALTGNSDAVTIEDGKVTIGLATIIDAVKTQLVDAGFAIADRIPEINATFTIFQSADLDKVQNFIGWLDGLSSWLPVIGLILLGVAIAIARDRRRVVLAAGVAVAASMLLLGAALNVIRPFYLDALPASVHTAAAGVLYDQVVSFIRFALRGLLVLGIAIAVGAWLGSAPGGTGAAARSGSVARHRRRPARGWPRRSEHRSPRRVPPAVPIGDPRRHPGGGCALVLLDRPPHGQHCPRVRGRRGHCAAAHASSWPQDPQQTQRPPSCTTEDGSGV